MMRWFSRIISAAIICVLLASLSVHTEKIPLINDLCPYIRAKRIVTYGCECYSFSPEQSTWRSSRGICKRSGGRLAVISTEKQQKWLERNVEHTFSLQKNAWIGLKRDEESAVPRWHRGKGMPPGQLETSDYVTWGSALDSPPGGGNCFAMTEDNSWKWSALRCNDVKVFICQFDIKQVARCRVANGYYTDSRTGVEFTKAEHYGWFLISDSNIYLIVGGACIGGALLAFCYLNKRLRNWIKDACCIPFKMCLVAKGIIKQKPVRQKKIRTKSIFKMRQKLKANQPRRIDEVNTYDIEIKPTFAAIAETGGEDDTEERGEEAVPMFPATTTDLPQGSSLYDEGRDKDMCGYDNVNPQESSLPERLQSVSDSSSDFVETPRGCKKSVKFTNVPDWRYYASLPIGKNQLPDIVEMESSDSGESYSNVAPSERISFAAQRFNDTNIGSASILSSQSPTLWKPDESSINITGSRNPIINTTGSRCHARDFHCTDSDSEDEESDRGPLYRH